MNRKTIIPIAVLMLCLIIVIASMPDIEEEPSSYRVSFISNTRDSVPTQIILSGGKVQKPTVQKDGYIFDGWFYNNQKWDFENNVVVSDITLVAQWKPLQYVITFDSNGGDFYDSITIFTGDMLSLPTPTLDLYEFAGWYYGDKKITDGAFYHYTDMKLVAKWNKLQKKIFFDTNGGEEIEALKVDIFSTIEELPTPTKQDSIFLGWYIDENEMSLPYEFKNSDITVKAKWLDIDEIFEFTNDEANGIKITKYIGSEKEVVIPLTIEGKTVTTMATDAFNNTNVESITFSAQVQNFEYKSLFGCNNLKKINIAGNTTATLVYMFGGESNIPSSLKEINFVDGTSTYGKGIFDNLSPNRTFTVNIFSTLSSTPKDAFYECSNISELYFPEGLITISDRTVCAMDNLTVVNIPSTVKSMGINAFVNIPKVQYLIIPKSVMNLKYASLAATDSIIFIEHNSKPAQWSSSIFSIYENEMNIFYGFEEITENDDFVYALCKVGSVKQCVILNNKTNSPIPELIDGYAVAELK